MSRIFLFQFLLKPLRPSVEIYSNMFGKYDNQQGKRWISHLYNGVYAPQSFDESYFGSLF